MSDDIMNKRQRAIDEHYEAQWDGGKGSHHPDYDPEALGEGVEKANRETEELLNAIIKARVLHVDVLYRAKLFDLNILSYVGCVCFGTR
eukprot:CAMPEP_0114226766 /NCGR_PEP_ID=MMETSP0058-20121206/1413_1 /TAXON_ID=36894 /ORGANISM="Pyramimonas parkeae, CCMP726" /LENGTH=88 /DNA_ID=CAMNT_0001337525 /DNA_START=103 /DNA_END=369 /DNA_ORIENTATION=+